MLAHFPDLHMFLFTSQGHEGRRDENTKGSFANFFSHRDDGAKSPENGMPRGDVIPERFQSEGFSERRALFTIIEENSAAKMRGVLVSDHKEEKNAGF